MIAQYRAMPIIDSAYYMRGNVIKFRHVIPLTLLPLPLFTLTLLPLTLFTVTLLPLTLFTLTLLSLTLFTLTLRAVSLSLQ